MTMLTLSRPALVLSDPVRLDAEYRAAQWIHHRLLDFEDQHQELLDKTADEIAPGIVRVGRILSRLAKRARRAQRTTPGRWYPRLRLDLVERLRPLLAELRAVRDADPRWKEVLRWADENVGKAKAPRRRRAKDPRKLRRRKDETDEAWEKRFDLLTHDETDEHFAKKLAEAPKRTRREEYQAQLYAKREIYWGTWNALVASVKQARQAVLKRRKQGLAADWRRPRFGDNVTLAADPTGFRIVDRGPLWWTIELRLGTSKEWVRVRAKCGNWHAVADDARITTAKLTRRRDGQRWRYSVSLTVEGVEKRVTKKRSATGLVAFDWGHREHGHETAALGIRAFVWHGDDGESGEIHVPPQCRTLLDEIDSLKSRIDKTWDARKRSLPLYMRSRQGYRKYLCKLGVRTEEEAAWLRWEMRYERRIARRRRRIQNLRKEHYQQVIRKLRERYATFAFEDQAIHDAEGTKSTIRELQTDEMRRRRQRANRDLTARYEFVSLCEQSGASVITVDAHGTSQECPTCGSMTTTAGELLVACSGCGKVRDRDFGAAQIILRRAQDATRHAAE